MFDLIAALHSVLDKSAKQAITQWLGKHPKEAYWHVISDYVFDDPNRHDTAAFVILLHHEKLQTIIDHVHKQAPVDIKKSRTASNGLIQYLNSPVIFSYTFVLDEGDNFLATYATKTEMIGGIEDLIQTAALFAANSATEITYFSEVTKRLSQFKMDMEKNGNAKLARKLFLVAAFASVVLEYLDQSASPANVSWISDRDAILQRYDGVVWDIAAIMFYVIKDRLTDSTPMPSAVIERPKLLHIEPDKGKLNYLDPLIRMPDYLAAAASGLNFHTCEYSAPKLEKIGSSCFFYGSNHVLCTLSWTGQGFYVRRVIPGNA